MDQLLQIVVTGLAIGAVYSLIAVGFTIVFNSTKVTNFAQGDFVMMGGLISAWLNTSENWSIPAAICVSTATVALLAVLMDVVGLQRARHRTALSLAMITIGFSIAYRGLMQVTVGREVLFLPRFGVFPDVRAAGVYLGSQNIWILASLLAISAALSFLFLKTRIGKAMRAVSQNPRAAALCGIEPKLVSALAFAMAGLTGAIAGTLIAPISAAFYDYSLGFGLKGFAAAILGGFGSPVGAVAGGFILGVVESLSARYLDSAYKDAIALAVLLVLLLAKPSGLFGKAEAKRI